MKDGRGGPLGAPSTAIAHRPLAIAHRRDRWPPRRSRTALVPPGSGLGFCLADGPDVGVGQLVPRIRTETDRAQVQGDEADDQDHEHDESFHDRSFHVPCNLFLASYGLLRELYPLARNLS